MEKVINGIPLDFIKSCFQISDAGFDLRELPLGLQKIITRGGGETEMPLFFLANGYKNDLFIVVRGATEAHDFVRCLNFGRTKFLDGEVHEGVLAAARWIIAQSREYIDECKGRIIVVGHSLGGATSSMIAAVLRLEEKKENVIAITAASFPIFSANIKKLTEPFITSFVFNNDVVPLLTQTNLQMIIQFMVATTGNLGQSVGGIIQMLQTILLQRGVQDQTIIAKLYEVVPGIVAKIMSSPVTENFLCPGTVLNVVRCTPGQDVFTIVPFVEGKPMANLLLIMTGVADHNLQLLIGAIESILATPSQPTGPTEVDDLD
ncbi:Lipase family protein [Histomonas meleagridis]|uniref:Lipase family protein n=1 Tax=Histomonas meleagridis TaxID=135588 RepID=UPI003559E0EF|nr:Lipase family protein [Histomonas meleagridis]KAH0805406.1 Lipase family protein [Histomonas meleagridis]